MGSSGQGCRLPRKTSEDAHHSPHLIQEPSLGISPSSSPCLLFIVYFSKFLHRSSTGGNKAGFRKTSTSEQQPTAAFPPSLIKLKIQIVPIQNFPMWPLLKLTNIKPFPCIFASKFQNYLTFTFFFSV